MAFLPKIAQVLTGQDLKIPNVATWWCGQPAELAHVRAHAAQMMIGPAMATRMPFETAAPHAIAGQMRGLGDDTDLHQWLSDHAGGLVGKELATLSTTPVYEDGALVPRPMTLRVFLARKTDGWQVMPGGFARIGASTDTTAISMRRGGSVADVWVISDTPVKSDTMLDPEGPLFQRASSGPLPSRAADNLFWLGRYIERTEGILRLVRAYNGRLDEAATATLLDAVRAKLLTFDVNVDEAFPLGLRATLASAVHSASQIRDRFSVDGWAALKDMEKSMARIAKTAMPGSDAALVMSVMLRKIAGFSGLVNENMYRAAGWQFLAIGRSLERAAMTCDLLATAADPKSPAGGLDLALEVGDSVMTHRQRYAVVTRRESVVDLLALDENNPRSVRFHLDILVARVRDLNREHSDPASAQFLAQVEKLQAEFARQTADQLDTKSLLQTYGAILSLSRGLHATFVR
jgi:uncharacterized alpha-E superfamily protein